MRLKASGNRGRRSWLKRSLVGLGAFGAVAGTAVPLAACGAATVSAYGILPTYTGQADILLSLGVAPDYYPYQLNQSGYYDYLIDPEAHMFAQAEAFKGAFAQRLRSLLASVRDGGRSWWNQNAEKNDNSNPDPEYWTHKRGDLVLYEHYLLDDDKKAIDGSQAPGYALAVETNFRASRDPYTRLSKALIDGHEDANSKLKALPDDLTFADAIYHRMQDDAYFAGLLYGQTSFVFDADKSRDNWLAKLYSAATVTQEFKDALGVANIAYLDRSASIAYPGAASAASAAARSLARSPFKAYAPLAHHPIYDAQTEVGEAPAYEGAVRDNLLYVYTLASDVAARLAAQPAVLADDPRRQLLLDAPANAKKILEQFKARQAKIRDYFKDQGIAGKTFAIVTVAPGTAGADTIQTNGKYSFVYRDLGLAQPWPKKWAVPSSYEGKTPTEADVTFRESDAGGTASGGVFNIDDNGWFWDISKRYGNVNVNEFASSADFGVVAARQNDWNNLPPNYKSALTGVFKNAANAFSDTGGAFVNYDLWNEGLKTPFVLHMLLDQVLAAAVKYKQSIDASYVLPDAVKSELYSWGDYWTKDFVA